MSQDAPATASSRALLEAAVRLRRVLLMVTGILIAAQALWVLALGVQRPLATLLVGALVTMALLSSIWILLGRMARSGFAALAAWVAGGYLLRIGILLAALLGGRAAGLDLTVMGVSLIAAIIAGMLAETIILSRARILTVEPGTSGDGA